MPTYCYRDKDDNLIEKTMTIAEHEEFKAGGSDGLTRDLMAEHGDHRNTHAGWPVLSDAAGVLPEQINDARQHSVKVGVPTDFTSDGRAVFESRAHRRKYLKAIGWFDKDAGYSDPTPA